MEAGAADQLPGWTRIPKAQSSRPAPGWTPPPGPDPWHRPRVVYTGVLPHTGLVLTSYPAKRSMKPPHTEPSGAPVLLFNSLDALNS